MKEESPGLSRGECQSTDKPLLDALSLVNVGAWLIPLGLVLALIGGKLLEHRELEAGG